jgi:hypothetical protein
MPELETEAVEVDAAVREAQAEAAEDKPQERSALREAFDKIRAKQEAEAAVKPKLEAPKDKAEPEKGEEPEPEEKQPDKPKVSKERKRMVDALVLDGADRETVEAVGDDVLAGWHSRYLKRNADTTKAFQERADLQKKIAELEAAQKSEPDVSAVPADKVDLTPPKPLLDALGLDADDDAAKSLGTWVDSLMGPMREALTTLTKENEAHREAAFEQLLQANRARLGERLPQLKESERAWNALVAAANDIAKEAQARGEQIPDEQAFDLAAAEVYGEQDKRDDSAEKEEEKAAKRKQRANAKPTTATSRREGTVSGEVANRRVYDYLQKHPGDVEGAKRLRHSLTGS